MNARRRFTEGRADVPGSPNFEFHDGHGKWHEVDLLVLGRRLYLVELKYYTGTLRGDDHTWHRNGHRPGDSPLKLARRKAQRLARWSFHTPGHETGSSRPASGPPPE